MGKTYRKNSSSYDDDNPSKRSGKQPKHSNNRKGAGMRTLNSYDDVDYDLDDDVFEDDIEIDDTIYIQHTKTNR